MEEDELFITDEQILLSILSIGTIIISIILLFNSRSKKTKRKGFINNKEEYYLTLFNRIILFIIFFIFLVIDYNEYIKIKKQGNKNIRPYFIQLISGILVLAASVLTLYISFLTRNELNADLENPTL